MIAPTIQSVIAIVSDTYSGSVENCRSKQFLLIDKAHPHFLFPVNHQKPGGVNRMTWKVTHFYL